MSCIELATSGQPKYQSGSPGSVEGRADLEPGGAVKLEPLAEQGGADS